MTGKASQNSQGERHQSSTRGARRREEIVEAAFELFARSGFRGTSVADVADQVGITEPGLLYHFGTKEGLLRAVVEHRVGQTETFAIDIAALGGLPAIRAIPAFTQRNLTQPNVLKLFAVLLAENLEPDDLAHNFFVARHRTLRASIADAIRIGQRRGEIRPDVDAQLKSVEILGALDGVITQWLLDPEAVDLMASTESYAEALERDLSAVGPHP